MFILNDANAVKTFAQAGSITLGGNVSIAAGPVGRNAEASGAASLRSVAGIFSYSKTKGLFAGVSLEGSVIVERRDANKKLYNANVTAKQLLSGTVPPPPEADALIRILNARVFRNPESTDDMYNDVPVYDDIHDDNIWEGRRGDAMGENPRDPNVTKPQRSSTWQDDIYDRNMYNENPNRRTTTDSFDDDFGGSGKPGMGAKPDFKKPARASTMGVTQAVALYTFDAGMLELNTILLRCS